MKLTRSDFVTYVTHWAKYPSFVHKRKETAVIKVIKAMVLKQRRWPRE